MLDYLSILSRENLAVPASREQRLSRLIGKAKAIELMALGKTFEFEEAQRLGLVDSIFPAETFSSDVMSYARQFLPPHKASKAVGRIKRAVQTGWELPFQDALALERELQQQLFESEDAREGLSAYAEKRQPKFQGK